MWHRRILKAQARANLKGIFLVSGLVALITIFLNLEYFEIISDSIFTENVQAAVSGGFSEDGLLSGIPLLDYSLLEYLHVPFELLVPLIGLGAGLIAILFKMFIGSPAQVGEIRYFLTVSRNRERADWRILFSVFKDQNYFNIVKVKLITEMKIFLWTLLLVIPGLIKAYEYQFITWLLAENPEMDQKTAQRISSGLTMGHKADMFIMDLSMLGWQVLSLVTFGLAWPFVVSYMNATHTELYETLKSHSIGNGDVFNLA